MGGADLDQARYQTLTKCQANGKIATASYSGFETCVEQLGSRLVERGHEVTVYCRSHHVAYDQPTYKGMRLVKLPTVKNKYLDTIVHSFLSSLHALGQGYDIVLYFIAGNSLVSWIPRLAGQTSILNVDGLDWKRAKWPPLAKRYIQFAERMATVLPNAFLTDSRVVQQFYRDTYHADSPYIAYGAELPIRPAGAQLAQWGLEARRYVLFVGRLVPENCADHPRIIFTGYCFGEGYWELTSNAYLFVETSGVGGTHPALVEAMAFGNCVVAHDTAENQETIDEAGIVYDGASGASALAPRLQQLLDDPALVAVYRQKAAARAAAYYSWEKVTDDYEALFKRLRPVVATSVAGRPE